MRVLSDGQDAAIVLLQRSLVVLTVMIIVAVMLTALLGVDGDLRPRRKNLPDEKMMHPVRRGRGEKKPERGGDAQV